jgi:hypothetical protein
MGRGPRCRWSGCQSYGPSTPGMGVTGSGGAAGTQGSLQDERVAAGLEARPQRSRGLAEHLDDVMRQD